MTAAKVRKKSRFKIYALAVLILLAGLGSAGVYVYNLVYSPYKGYSENTKIVIIQPGSSVNDIIHALVSSGVLKSGRGFRVILRLKGGEHSLLAGEYLFDRPMNALEVYDKFRRGDVYYHRFTVPEGKDVFDISVMAEDAGLFKKTDFLNILNDPSQIKSLDPKASSLEGYIFPDTYLVSRIMTPREVISIMTNNFESKYDEYLAGPIKERNLDLRKIVIIASIIEKETSMPEERSLISSVIYNRLKLGMGLQTDPTIIYALKLEGIYDGNLKREHKAKDSPYNTYKYRGLPPGPICNPGISSLIAACSPADTKFLYYVSRNDGSHVFTTNISDHNQAVYIWQKKYWRDKWREESLNKTDGVKAAPATPAKDVSAKTGPKLIQGKKKEI
jgi:UPF0755 protein